MNVKRGDVVLVDLPKINGSIQYGKRPCLVIQNDVGNRFSPVVIVVPCTTRTKKKLPTHVEFVCKQNHKFNTALCEQILTISKSDIQEKICVVSDKVMKDVNKKLKISLGVMS